MARDATSWRDWHAGWVAAGDSDEVPDAEMDALIADLAACEQEGDNRYTHAATTLIKELEQRIEAAERERDEARHAAWEIGVERAEYKSRLAALTEAARPVVASLAQVPRLPPSRQDVERLAAALAGPAANIRLHDNTGDVGEAKS